GPDNGLFSFVMMSDDACSAVTIEAAAYRRSVVSRTFHGRDVFAPAAAHLASGVPLSRLGPPVTDPVKLTLPVCRRAGDEIVGETLGSERFGNLPPSVPADSIRDLAPDGRIAIVLPGREITTVAQSYEEGGSGAVAAIVGSSERLEIFVRNGSARAV